ncbi:hypothetical protein CASFOL_037496 [Castilleja foliolosa]|uniref:Uncharacterized protein n=1 Tax=Castilleja foliolosa TaxID=1961234 RepID=A0ABD3BPP5_9LAMI
MIEALYTPPVFFYISSGVVMLSFGATHDMGVERLDTSL